MGDESERSRARRDGRRPPSRSAEAQGAPAFLGLVTSQPAAGKFFRACPIAPSGGETDGGAASYGPPGPPVLVYWLGGSASVGDRVVCRFVNYRWVASTNRRSTPTLASVGFALNINQPCFNPANPYAQIRAIPYVFLGVIDPSGRDILDPANHTNSYIIVSGPPGQYSAIIGTRDCRFQIETTAVPFTVTGQGGRINLDGPPVKAYCTGFVINYNVAGNFYTYANSSIVISGIANGSRSYGPVFYYLLGAACTVQGSDLFTVGGVSGKLTYGDGITVEASGNWSFCSGFTGSYSIKYPGSEDDFKKFGHYSWGFSESEAGPGDCAECAAGFAGSQPPTYGLGPQATPMAASSAVPAATGAERPDEVDSEMVVARYQEDVSWTQGAG